MPRNTVNVCLTLPTLIVKKLDAKAQSEERPRSFVVKKILEHCFADTATPLSKARKEPADHP